MYDANFSLHERDIMVSLIQKHKSTLENKQSDASTWKQKEAAWEAIQNEFNARSGGTFRTTKTLKVKYEGLKRIVRKKSAAIRSELYRTGGGRNTAPPLDNVEEQVKAMITLSTDGRHSIYDSDVIQENQGTQNNINVPDEQVEISMIDVPEIVESNATQNEVVVLVANECEPLPATSSADMVEIEENLESMDNSALLDSDTPKRKSVIIPNSKKTWDVSSRKNLKSKKHPALIANVPKRTLFDELTQAKLELVQL
ncbi:unnamed protein product [Spodoptera littoralis]|uniref:Regulatory protein zeste n=1 Tax=Spodoptera littoralis TaxID=7109 RepID=A0A9P0I9A6_SPOLI|nr:unnamed protein product [Spodoptera littoralis]CAH1642073.1 unnamed protein product [Spodoptera littoralis]